MGEGISYSPEGAEEFVAPVGEKPAIDQGQAEVQPQPEALSELGKEQARERLTFLQGVIEDGKKYFPPSRVAVGVALAASLFGTGCEKVGVENPYTSPETASITVTQRVEHRLGNSNVFLEQAQLSFRKMSESHRFDKSAPLGSYELDSNSSKGVLEYSSQSEQLPLHDFAEEAVRDYAAVLESQGYYLITTPADTDYSQYFDPKLHNPKLQNAPYQYYYDQKVLHVNNSLGLAVYDELRLENPNSYNVEGDAFVPHDVGPGELGAIGIELANRLQMENGNEMTMRGEKVGDTYRYRIENYQVISAIHQYLGTLQHQAHEPTTKERFHSMYEIAVVKVPRQK